MNGLNLASLLDSLSEQAGLTKVASEETEKKEKKDEEKTESEVDKAKRELNFAKKDGDKAEAENDDEKDKKEKKDEQTKEAAAKGADLAKQIMQKVASLSLEQVNTEDTMNKQAADTGKALAEALLEKLASVGDQNTTNGIGSAVPNKTQIDLAAQVAEQDRVIQNQPGTDGNGNGGTLNQIFDAIVADALAKGVAPMDQTASLGVAKAEGAQVANQSPNQVVTGSWTTADDEHEKAAAVSSLVADGHSFEDAVNMVKSAAEALEQEEMTQIKQAALSHFIEKGFDFETAVGLVKTLG